MRWLFEVIWWRRELKSLEDLKDGAVVGTSSIRRRAQLEHYYEGLVARECRGNVYVLIFPLTLLSPIPFPVPSFSDLK